MTKLLAALPVIMLTVAHGGVDFYVTFLQALAPGMAERLDIPLGKIVALVGIGQLVLNGVQPLAGWIMGKRNLSWILWFGLLLSIMPVFMGWVDSFRALAVLVLIGCVGTGSFHPEGLLSATDRSGDHAHIGVPFFMAGGYVFTSATAPIVIHWVKWFGFPALAWFAVPGFALVIFFFLVYQKRRREHPSVVLRPRSRRVAKVREGHMSFWPLLCVAMFGNTATALFMAIVTSHYELSFGPEAREAAGWVLLIIGGLGSLTSFFWSHLCRKNGPRYFTVVMATQPIAAVLFYFLATASTPALGLAIALPLSVISPGAVYPVSVSLIRNASGSTQAIRAGLMIGGTWGAAGLIVMGTGVLLNYGVNSSHLMAISALACLGSGLIAAIQVFRRRRKSPVR